MSGLTQYSMSSIQIHHINGTYCPYRHTYINGKVVCVLVKGSHPDRRMTSTGTPASTRLANSPHKPTERHDGRGTTAAYQSQDDLDEHIRRSYTNAGYGVVRIQEIFENIDLHPTRRETENYLTKELGVVLRKRKKEPKTLTSKETRTAEARDEYAAAQQELESQRVADEISSKEQHIKSLESEVAATERQYRQLIQKLRNYRDTGRAPTDAEIDSML